MVASKRIIDVPYGPIADENGNITSPWLDFLGTVALAVGKLRDAAEAMDDLSTGTDGQPTASDLANAWEEIRSPLQDIT